MEEGGKKINTNISVTALLDLTIERLNYKHIKIRWPPAISKVKKKVSELSFQTTVLKK